MENFDDVIFFPYCCYGVTNICIFAANNSCNDDQIKCEHK